MLQTRAWLLFWVGLGTFLGGAVLENRFHLLPYLAAAGKTLSGWAATLNPASWITLAAFCGVVFVLAGIKLVERRRWRALTQKPQYILHNRRPKLL
ncbi:hypothetical protein ACP3TJ_01670 [Desulforudis sp. 1088]|uniref:hypothetical protein n=1 Tax=unclassified Candidatus Desulforudis TaxID=2635950 RepID=UPI00347F27AD